MNEIRDIHKPLIQWLRRNNLPYLNHRPDVKSGIRSGWPDFSIFLAGRCLFLEAKTASGVISANQRECIADLQRAGCVTRIVRSASEAISAVMEWTGVENPEIQPPERENAGFKPSVDIYLGHAREMFANAGRPGLPQGPCQCEICKKVRPTVGLTLFPDPLDNERAAELIAAATTDRPLWIASVGGVDTVLYGDPNPGGLARILRKATPQDMRDLPRK